MRKEKQTVVHKNKQWSIKTLHSKRNIEQQEKDRHYAVVSTIAIYKHHRLLLSSKCHLTIKAICKFQSYLEISQLSVIKPNYQPYEYL